MENQPQPHKSRRKNPQPVRSTTGTSSHPPLNPETQRPTPAAQTTVPATLPTGATETKATPSTTAQPLVDISETEKVMREFLAKFGQEEKPSAVLAKMAEAFRLQEEASQLTPLYIPPRKFNLQEIATTSTSFPAPDLPPEGEIECTVEEVMEEAERAEKEREAEKRTGEDVVIEEDVIEKDDVVEGEDLDVAADDNARNSEGGVDDKGDAVADIEGQIPTAGVEGETPEKIIEGDIPGKNVEGETPEEDDEGETPVETEEIEEPESGGLKTLVDPEEGIPHDDEEKVADDSNGEEESEKEIVNLDDEEENTPVDDRTARRATRRSKMQEELAKPTPPRKLQFGASQGEGHMEDGDSGPEKEPEAGVDPSQAEEKRLAAERKRKGKLEAKTLTKKHRPDSSTPEIEESSPEAIRVPFAKGLEEPRAGSEAEHEDAAYEMTEIVVTKRLLEAMAEFDDPRRAETYKERGASGKLVKSGKQYDSGALQEIESEGEFLSYIGDIGFEWLLTHSTTEVPVALAKEFFSTFKFKSTMDPDADSISFRLFNEEYVMSIREWSLRMGLFTHEEDEDGVWNERMIGPPKNTPGFKPQSAWEFITHKRGGTFKTSGSKGFHITNHLLRFAQVFIGYNLMGTASSALTTPELYFTWCMAKKIKVHLGYWLAQACHLMTSNNSRHLYTCHLLGAYLQRNIVMKISKSVTDLPMCDPPELFNVDYFFNKGLLYMDGEEVCFYEIGRAVTAVAAVKVEEGVTPVEREEWKQEMGAMRGEVEEIKGGMANITSALMGLKGAVEKQTDKMTEALTLMMRMVAATEQRIAQAPQVIPPRPSGHSSLPTPGKLISQQTTVNPAATTSRKRKEYTTTPSTSVPAQRTVSKPVVKNVEEEPASSVPKKVKVNRPKAPQKPGSRGGQTQN